MITFTGISALNNKALIIKVIFKATEFRVLRQTFWQVLYDILKILRSFVKHKIFIDCVFNFPFLGPHLFLSL